MFTTESFLGKHFLSEQEILDAAQESVISAFPGHLGIFRLVCYLKYLWDYRRISGGLRSSIFVGGFEALESRAGMKPSSHAKLGVVTGDMRGICEMFLRLHVFAFWLKKKLI